MVTRSSASAALAAPRVIDTTVQRIVLSAFWPIAVKTWVPSGISEFAIVTGISNTGSKPLRTHSSPSLRLMKTDTGRALSRFGVGLVEFGSDAGAPKADESV